jgi:hypothetical protein
MLILALHECHPKLTAKPGILVVVPSETKKLVLSKTIDSPRDSPHENQLTSFQNLTRALPVTQSFL